MRPARSRLALPALLLLSLAVLAIPGVAEAQRFRLIRLGAAGGWSESRDFAVSGDQDGSHAQLSVSVRPAMEWLELRGDFTYHRFNQRRIVAPCLSLVAPCPEVLERDRIASAVLNAAVHPLTHWISPYVSGGVGFYRLKTTSVTFFPPCAACAFIDAPVRQGSSTYHSSAGLNAGGGVAVTVRGISLFAEGRYHRLYVSGEDRSMVPVTVGVMF